MKKITITLSLILIVLVGCDNEDHFDTYLAEKLNARSMDDLVQDAREGRTRYVDEMLTLRVTVKDTSTLERSGYLTIETDYPAVEFIIDMGDLPYEKWKTYKEGKKYTFTLLITGMGRVLDRSFLEVDYDYYISAQIVTLEFKQICEENM